MAVLPFGGGRLDKILDIVFSHQVQYAAAQTYPEWDLIEGEYGDREKLALARSIRFRIETELGYASKGAPRSPGAKYSFPKGAQGQVKEFEANFKERASTVLLTYSLYKQAQTAKDKKLFEPLAREQNNSAIAEARLQSAEVFLDGTGVRGVTASIVEANIATGTVVLTLRQLNGDMGHANCFEYGDIYMVASAAGVEVTPSGPGDYYGYRMVDIDRDAQTVTLQIVGSVGEEDVILTKTATNIVAGNVWYRAVQRKDAIPNLTTLTDYSAASNIFPGLESLTATDGRRVHGMDMTGILKGTRLNLSGDPLDAMHIERYLNTVNTRMGRGRFTFKQMICDTYVREQLLMERETDRKFISKEDGVRGCSYWAYAHEQGEVRLNTSEYVRRRIWFLPVNNEGKKVLTWYGSPWQDVGEGGLSSTHLGIDSEGSHTTEMLKYRRSVGVLVNKAPGALGCIEGYGLSTYGN